MKEIDVTVDVHSTRLAELCVRSTVLTSDCGICLADIAMNLRWHTRMAHAYLKESIPQICPLCGMGTLVMTTPCVAQLLYYDEHCIYDGPLHDTI